MSFMEEADAAAVLGRKGDRCVECRLGPHPTTGKLFQLGNDRGLVCLSCLFRISGEEKRARNSTPEFRELLQQRHEHTLLFMGNGEHSAKRRRALLERVRVAFEFLSGAQQAPMSTDTKECCDSHRDFSSETDRIVDAVVKDLAMALTGKEWEPKED